MSKVLIGVPTYGLLSMGWIAARQLWAFGTRRTFTVEMGQSSLISYNCNFLWCAALNRRGEGHEWFAMLHTDIEPADWWIDSLIAEAEKHGADLVSAVVPKKDASGLTTTCIGTPQRPMCNLTQAQVQHPTFPDTFDLPMAIEALARLPEPLRVAELPGASHLLVNTGCFVCRLDRPWVEQVWFDQTDSIERVNGTWRPVMCSEDWNFSRRVAQAGAKVMATRTVNLTHRGHYGFPSNAVWGQERDTLP
jgi:hypothetical protein